MSNITKEFQKLGKVEGWLNWQHIGFMLGIKSVEDAIILYEYALLHEELPELADTWDEEDLIKSLGYNPWTN